MRPVDADKLPVQKVYSVDEAGFGATYYMVDYEDIKSAPTIECLAPQWISVKERLPEKSGDYLVTTYNGNRTCLPYSSKNRAFNSFDGNTDHVLDIPCTHWMPLPELPKEENDG